LGAERFIANRIVNSGQGKGTISKPIVKIGIIGITLGVAVMILTVSIVLGFKNEIVERITGLTTHIAVSNVNVNPGNEQEPIKISQDTLQLIRQLPFVAGIQRTAFKNGLLKTDFENEGVLLKGVGEEYGFDFIKSHLIEGRLIQFDKEEVSKEMLISQSLANKMGLTLNQKVQLHFIAQHAVYDSLLHETIIKSEPRSRKLTVCGIFKTNFVDFDEKLTFVDIRQIQKLNYWDSTMVGTYEIKVKDFNLLDKNLEQIWDLLGYNYTVSSVKELYANIFIWLEKLDINGVIIVVLMVLVATINMITALLILILERTNMVGLIKALGMSNVKVRKIFFYISLRLIGRGLLWGNIVGIGLCLLQYFFEIAKLDSETYYVDHVAVQLNWGYFLILNASTFSVCLLMLFLPTLVLTKLTPIKTLKFD
jgi:lipoprotein-releasing system permease protein